MRYILIILLFSSGISYGQGAQSFGATRPQDTSFTKAQLKLPALATGGASNFLKVDAAGHVITGPGSGTAVIDTHYVIRLADSVAKAVVKDSLIGVNERFIDSLIAIRDSLLSLQDQINNISVGLSEDTVKKIVSDSLKNYYTKIASDIRYLRGPFTNYLTENPLSISSDTSFSTLGTESYINSRVTPNLNSPNSYQWVSSSGLNTILNTMQTAYLDSFIVLRALANTKLNISDSGIYTSRTKEKNDSIALAALIATKGTGSVTTLTVTPTNGFAGTVANATTTPALTLTTTVNGLVKGNGTALSPAVAGTDYQAAGSYLTTTLSDGKINIGNSSNIATAVTPSGDATISNAGVITLNTVNTTPGSVGSSSVIPTYTSNAKGQITTQGTVAVAIPASAITSGTMALARGGTNADLSATGGASQFLKQVSTGAAVAVGRPLGTDILMTGYAAAPGTPAATDNASQITSKMYGNSLMIAYQNTSISVTGTTSETTLNILTIPAGVVGANDEIVFDQLLSRPSTGVGTNTYKLYLNTSASLSGATQIATVSAVGTTLSLRFTRRLVNKNSTSLNEIYSATANAASEYTATVGAITTVNANFTNTVYAILTVTPASALDNAACNNMTIKISRAN